MFTWPGKKGAQESSQQLSSQAWALGPDCRLSDPTLAFLWFASAWYMFDVVVSAFLPCILVTLQYDAAPLAIVLEKSVRLGQRVSIVLQPMAPTVLVQVLFS